METCNDKGDKQNTATKKPTTTVFGQVTSLLFGGLAGNAAYNIYQRMSSNTQEPEAEAKAPAPKK